MTTPALSAQVQTPPVQHMVSTYARRVTGSDAGTVTEILARTEVWEPAELEHSGAVQLAGLPGLWRLAAVVGDIPEDAEPLTAGQYTAALAEFRAQARATAEAHAQKRAAQRQADFDALVAARIPADVASRLTHHVPGANR